MAKIQGSLEILASLTIDGGRFEESKGADVSAANNLTLGTDGNLFTITGNTQINAITTANWQAGSVLRLLFTGTPTVKNNTAGGAGTAVILLSGGIDFTAAANDILTLAYDGTSWHETARKTTSGNSPVSISSLIAAIGTNTINNANLNQEWQWNTLAGNTGLKLSSTSTAAASLSQKVLEIALSGANSNSNQDTYGIYSSNTHTGTGSHNFGIYGTASGGAVNYGVYGNGVIGVTGATTSSGGYGVQGIGGSGIGILGNTSSNIGVEADANGGGIPIYAQITNSSTNTAQIAIKIFRNANGSAAANGIGSKIVFYSQDSSGTASSNLVNEIISTFTDVTDATRTSKLEITGVNSGSATTMLSITGAGDATFLGSVKTADPGAGAGAWKLGKYLAATVTLVTDHYVEVAIDGSTHKLALVN